MAWKWVDNGLLDTDADDYILWALMPVPDDAVVCVKPEYENMIAAAPLLLAAGQAALSYLSDQDARDDMSDAGFIRYDDVVDALRAAIAAARGTTEVVCNVVDGHRGNAAVLAAAPLLLAALESVGWVDGQEPAKGMGGMMEQVCPWCDKVAGDDWAHNPGCIRQAAIAAARGK